MKRSDFPQTNHFDSSNAKEPIMHHRTLARALSNFFLLAGVTVTTATISAQTTQLDSTNPFAAASRLPFEAPDFAAIRDEHYQPAMLAGIAQQLAESVAIADQQEAPTFENTIVAMERSGEILTRVSRVFSNMSSAHSNPTIQKIQLEMAPRLAAHSDNILLNRKLFARVQKLYEERDSLKLNEEQQQLLKESYDRFIRAGAMLTDEQPGQISFIVCVTFEIRARAWLRSL